MPQTARRKTFTYGRFLLLIAGLGGLLYGIDVGIIAAALIYLAKTVDLTVAETSLIVAAVLGGSTVSSLVAGFLADWIGRRKMMIGSGLLFVTSVAMIVSAHGFGLLLTGRLLQGVSGGVIAVVVPLYLAECLSAETRGRGTAIFQFLLTVGIVVAAFTGHYYTTHAEAAIAAAGGNAVLIRAIESHAWRGMFLSVIYPGLVFFVGAFFLSESPRWLFKKDRPAEAMVALRRSSTEEEAELQMREMEELAAENKKPKALGVVKDSLLRRKYVVPFVLACVILACTQATGINSVLSYLVLILLQAGMTAAHATQANFGVVVLNMAMTVVAVALIDKRGRKFLLTIGTGGIIVALLAAAFFFHSFESKRSNVLTDVQAAVQGDALALPVAEVGGGVAGKNAGAAAGSGKQVLTVLYSYGSGGSHVDSALSSDKDPVLRIAAVKGQRLEIERATLGPVPPETMGWIVTACLALFIAFYAVGPGVVVWLTLSELMPTRIRSAGMGIALLVNQGVSTLIAGVFLPIVGRYGYSTMFIFWAGCTVIYFITAVFFLPETKGRTLEEIEKHFESGGKKQMEAA